jgi:ABC-type transport system involved in cytochrome bd biosynthesis fused ATPase/permease subunit
MALLRAYQAEFNKLENRNWVDSLADGFNRLIRPMIVSLILFIFVVAYISPSHLAEITLAISAIPDGYWTLLSVIIAFYFGGRMQLKSQQFRFSETQAQAVKALIETKAEFRKLEIDNDEPDRLIGDSAAKDSDFDKSRAAQINTVVETALQHAVTDPGDDKQKAANKEALSNKVSEMLNETPETLTARRKFGPRKLGRR